MTDELFGWDDELDNLLSPNAAATRKVALEQGERRNVAILFLDIQGFTNLSQHLDPEEAKRIADTAFKVFTGIVRQFGGRVDKLLGDGMMALFGSERASERDVEQTIFTGLECIRQLQEVNSRLAMRKLQELSIRIGINYGEVVVGTVVGGSGSETVMGAEVNLAQRMESNAKTNSVLVPLHVFQAVASRFIASEPRRISVKGFDREIEVVDIIGIKPTSGLEQSDIPFIGRSHELEQQREWLRNKAEPMLLTGPAGIGKSRLLAEVLNGANRDPVVIRPPAAVPVSYGLVSAFLRKLLNLGTASITKEELIRALQHFDLSDESIVERFGLLLSVRGTGSTLRGFSGEALYRELVAALRSLFEKIPDTSACWVFDDGQWSDEISLRMISEAIDALSAPVWRVLLLREMGEVELPERLQQSSKLQLRPLNDDEADTLISMQVPGCYIPKRVRDLWRERGAGLPLLLIELGRHLKSQGYFKQTASGAWEMQGWLDDIGLPDSLSGLFRSRLDRLEPNQRTWLQIAAVDGAGFRVKVVEAVGQQLDLGTAPWLELIEAGWLNPAEEGFARFRSPMAQEAAYSVILKSNRESLHLLTAQAYEELFAGSLDELAPVLSRHWTGAGEYDKALESLASWRETAYNRYDFSAAITAIRKTIELLDNNTIQRGDDIRIECFLIEAQIRRTLSDFERAEEFIQTALQLISDTTDNVLRAKVWGEYAHIRYDQSRLIEALDYVDRALDICPANHDWAREGELLKAHFLMLLGRGKEGLALAHRCHDKIPHDFSEGGFRSRLHVVLGALYQAAGNYEAAHEAYVDAVETALKMGDRLNYAISSMSLASFYREHGRFEEAEELLSKVIETYTKIGDKLRLIRARHALSGVYIMSRRFDEARDLLITAAQQASELRNGLLEQAIHANLGVLFGMQGLLEDAERHFRSCCDICETIGARQALLNGNVNLLQVAILRGEWEHVHDIALSLELSGTETGNHFFAITGSLVRLYTMLQTNRIAEARELIDTISIQTESPRYPLYLSIFALLKVRENSPDSIEFRKQAEELRAPDDDTAWLLRYEAALRSGEELSELDEMPEGPFIQERAALIRAIITGEFNQLDSLYTIFATAGAHGFAALCKQLQEG